MVLREKAPINSESSDKAAKQRLKRDPLLLNHPTEIEINWIHNHHIGTFEELRWRSLNSHAKSRMEYFLRSCSSVAIAARSYENEVEADNPEKPFEVLMADR